MADQKVQSWAMWEEQGRVARWGTVPVVPGQLTVASPGDRVLEATRAARAGMSEEERRAIQQQAEARRVKDFCDLAMSQGFELGKMSDAEIAALYAHAYPQKDPTWAGVAEDQEYAAQAIARGLGVPPEMLRGKGSSAAVRAQLDMTKARFGPAFIPAPSDPQVSKRDQTRMRKEEQLNVAAWTEEDAKREAERLGNELERVTPESGWDAAAAEIAASTLQNYGEQDARATYAGFKSILEEEDARFLAAVDAAVEKQKQEKLAHKTREKETEHMKGAEIVTMLKADASEASIRVAARQLVKLVAEPLGGLLCRHLDPEEVDMPLRGRVGAFLQTEQGRGMVAMLASASLSALPIEADIKTRIARELRVNVLAEGGDWMADLFMEPLRKVISTHLQGVVPEVPAPELPAAVAGTAGGSVIAFADALKPDPEEVPVRRGGKKAG